MFKLIFKNESLTFEQPEFLISENLCHRVLIYHSFVSYILVRNSSFSRLCQLLDVYAHIYVVCY